MGWPNCTRVLRYSLVSSRTCSMAPRASATAPSVARSVASSSTSKEFLASTNCSAATSLNSMSAAPVPSMRRYSRSFTPAALRSTRNKANPPFTAAETISLSAVGAFTTSVLVPLMVKPAPAALAVVAFTAFRSKREPASACARATRSLPSAMAGSRASRCAFEPERSMIRAQSTALTAYGSITNPRPNCSRMMAVSTKENPSPPASSGKLMPIQPSSPNCCQFARLNPSGVFSRSRRLSNL